MLNTPMLKFHINREASSSYNCFVLGFHDQIENVTMPPTAKAFEHPGISPVMYSQRRAMLFVQAA
jgi:hypothetical protein